MKAQQLKHLLLIRALAFILFLLFALSASAQVGNSYLGIELNFEVQEDWEYDSNNRWWVQFNYDHAFCDYVIFKENAEESLSMYVFVSQNPADYTDMYNSLHFTYGGNEQKESDTESYFTGWFSDAHIIRLTDRVVVQILEK